MLNWGYNADNLVLCFRHFKCKYFYLAGKIYINLICYFIFTLRIKGKKNITDIKTLEIKA